MIREHDTVILTNDLPLHGLKRGDLGVVVSLHGDAENGVEFMALEGETIAVDWLSGTQVRAVKRHEMPSARLLEEHAS